MCGRWSGRGRRLPELACGGSPRVRVPKSKHLTGGSHEDPTSDQRRRHEGTAPSLSPRLRSPPPRSWRRAPTMHPPYAPRPSSPTALASKSSPAIRGARRLAAHSATSRPYPSAPQRGMLHTCSSRFGPPPACRTAPSRSWTDPAGKSAFSAKRAPTSAPWAAVAKDPVNSAAPGSCGYFRVTPFGAGDYLPWRFNIFSADGVFSRLRSAGGLFSAHPGPAGRRVGRRHLCECDAVDGRGGLGVSPPR